ncbi:MAG: hypothetical protein ABEJ36_00235 [Candidatus Nanosalina sp.]
MEELPTVSQIMTSDLVYFDPVIESKCEKFCEERNISYLPTLDRQRVQKYEDGEFKSRGARLVRNQSVEPDKYIFSRDLFKLFKYHEVVFIAKDSNIVGVIHFSDYNSKKVYSYLYKQIYELEIKLRELIVKNGIHEKYEWENHELDTEERKRDYLEETRLYELLDAAEKYEEDIQLGIEYENGTGEAVNKLRRQVMHGKQFVENENRNEQPLNFTQESFETFFKRVEKMDRLHRQVSSRLNMEELM